MKTEKTLRYISFAMLAALTVSFAVMTAGNRLGWPEGIYVSPPVIALWTLTAVFVSALLLRRRLYRRPVIFGIHVSLLLILSGACVTHFCASSDKVRLSISGEKTASCADGDIVFPDPVGIEEFKVKNCPGTDTPCGYECILSSGKGTRAVVSMNHPAELSGYTFILDSYDPDGVTFKVSRDPWGTGLAYGGYILLTVSFIGYFFLRNTSWRMSLRKLAAASFLLSVIPANAEISPRTADEFGDVLISYNGRICPVSTLANDFTAGLTGGETSIDGHGPEEVLAGFLFDFGEWKEKPVIRIKNRELRKILGADGYRVSYEDFLRSVARGEPDIEDPQTRMKFAADIDRFESVNMITSGEILRIFPVADGKGGTTWLSPTDNIPAHVESDHWLFIRKYLGLLNEQIQRGDEIRQKQLLESLDKYQRKVLGDNAPSEMTISTERLYNRISTLRWPPLAVVLSGAVLFGFAIFRRKNGRGIMIPAILSAWTSLLYVAALITMRWIISGHIPLSDGYGTMLFLALILLAVALIFHKNILTLSMGILGAGLALAVSVLAGSGASVKGLMPVLDSPLLCLHVMLVMTSYALFLLMALTGLAGIAGKKKDMPDPEAMINVMLYPAIALLAMGIFIGSVWANLSWGRYWGWDPKEVWALVTLLIYSFAAHPRLLPAFRRRTTVLWFAVIAFLSVLITYFGVNIFLGGLHSYA